MHKFPSSLSDALPFGSFAWLTHRASQGALSQLRGGNFKSGFIGAVIGGLSPANTMMRNGIGNPFTRTVIASVFGGLASKATGGSFEDGAMAAAFRHLLNEEQNWAEKMFSGTKPFAWHFEGRAKLNGAHPSYVEVTAENSQWRKLPPSQSIYHDNNVGSPEVKYIHPDGREAVFSADMTGYYEPYVDSRYMATFNYVNPPFPEWYDVGGYLDAYIFGQGHMMFDVLPYMIGGNVRGDN